MSSCHCSIGPVWEIFIHVVEYMENAFQERLYELVYHDTNRLIAKYAGFNSVLGQYLVSQPFWSRGLIVEGHA